MLPTLLRSSARVPAIARGFASSSVKRAKPVRVKKSEARRVVHEAPKPSDALTEAPAPPPPANPFVQSEQQAPQTFGGVMKEVRDWQITTASSYCDGCWRLITGCVTCGRVTVELLVGYGHGGRFLGGWHHFQ